jgi:phospholipase C
MCSATVVGLVAYYVARAAAGGIGRHGLYGGRRDHRGLGHLQRRLQIVEKADAARGGGVVIRGLLVGVVALVVAASLGGANAAKRKVPYFGHVIVVVYENHAQGDVIGNSDAPNFNSLASRYALLSHYSGIAHPSLPNYLALVSGSTHGIQDNCDDCVISARSLADTLRRKHLGWKAYAEGLPQPGFTGTSAGNYTKHHMPFLYFRNVLSKPASRNRVVPFSRFQRDLSAGRLPAFSFVVPDECHDMHDCSVATGDAWLGRFVSPLLHNRKLKRSVIFVVFDEPTDSDPPSDPVPALALGPLVKPGSVYSSKTTHYGLLRTIEEAWNLPRLGRSKGTAPITGIWR